MVDCAIIDLNNLNYDNLIKSWREVRLLGIGGDYYINTRVCRDHLMTRLPEFKGYKKVEWCMFCRTLFVNGKEIDPQEYANYRKKIEEGLYE